MPFASNEGVQLHYEVAGQGSETIVLVPGLGLAGVGWNAVAAHLEADFRLVILDPRGSGRSDAPDAPYTPNIVASDLAAVLDHAGVNRAHIVGLSMGGCISQDFALANPGRVKSLTMLSTWASGDAWITRLMEFRRDLILREGLLEQFRISFMVITSPFVFREIPETLAALEAAMTSNPPATHAYVRQIEYCLQHDRAEQLRTLDLPTLVITGSHDFLTPPTLGRDLAEALNGRYEEVEHGSHCLMIECPKRVAASISEFVRDLAETDDDVASTNQELE